jgi:hypothetical protein
MFSDCYELETIYVSDDWSTANVQISTYMFIGCEKLPGYKDSDPDYWDKKMATLTTDGGYLTYKAPGTPVATPATDATNTSLSLTQPTGNVTIRVKYYDQAEFADGLAPAAITGVQASTADPIVTPGTPKTIGTSDVKMGTVKYYAAQSSSTAPTYDSEGWSEAVPTAATFSEGDVYVWYYIAGAEPASVAARSDANTCSDSDIKRLTVNLIAPPTYDVSLNKTGLATGEPANWKAKSETVTTEVNLGTNDLEGVKKGETVTVTYTGSRKVIGVKAEKKAAPKLLNFSPLGQIFYYYEGETWGDAIRNHPENQANGWYIEEFGITVMYKGRALCDSAHDDDITEDTVVNPNGGYLWGPES